MKKIIALLLVIAFTFAFASCEVDFEISTEVSTQQEFTMPKGMDDFAEIKAGLYSNMCLQDLCDLWNLSVDIDIDTESVYTKKLVAALVSGDWKAADDTVKDFRYDVIVKVVDGDGNYCNYQIDLDKGLVYFTLPYISFTGYDCYKTLTESEITDIKDFCYYYFSEHLED